MIRRCVHSLWTGTPAFRGIERGPLLIATLSVCLARAGFRETVFVTDHRGHAIAQALGWEFGAVDTRLESLPAQGINHIWAIGKIAALLLATDDGEPALHTDLDVAWLQPPRPELLAGRLVAQSPEAPYGPEFDPYFAAARLARHAPFNCGIIGGSDVSLVRDYTAFALSLAWRLRDLPLDGNLASMTIEQAALAAFAAQNAVTVTTLLARPIFPADYYRSDYCHLAGPTKRDPVYLTRAEARLSRDFPDPYARFQAGFRALASGMQPPCRPAAIPA